MVADDRQPVTVMARVPECTRVSTPFDPPLPTLCGRVQISRRYIRFPCFSRLAFSPQHLRLSFVLRVVRHPLQPLHLSLPLIRPIYLWSHIVAMRVLVPPRRRDMYGFTQRLCGCARIFVSTPTPLANPYVFTPTFLRLPASHGKFVRRHFLLSDAHKYYFQCVPSPLRPFPPPRRGRVTFRDILLLQRRNRLDLLLLL